MCSFISLLFTINVKLGVRIGKLGGVRSGKSGGVKLDTYRNKECRMWNKEGSVGDGSGKLGCVRR